MKNIPEVANVICFTGTMHMAEKVVAEMIRVGYGGHTRLHWSFPNPFDKVLLKTMPHTKMLDDNIGLFNCSRMHYRIIKAAYELGHSHVFICEDDCRFRKDVENLHQALEDTPDFDVLLLDGVPPKKDKTPQLTPIADGWSSFVSMRSAACYILSRAAMKRIIWLYESAINPRVKARKARICDQWFERRMLGDLKLVMATPNIAVQQTMPGSRNSGNIWRLRGYETMGIDLNDYAGY